MRWPDCTGFGERQWDKPEGREVQPSKTLWDLLQLLIVPIMLVAFVYLLNASRNGRRCDQGQSKRSVPPSLQAAHAGRSDDPDGVNYTNTRGESPIGVPLFSSCASDITQCFPSRLRRFSAAQDS